MGDGVIDLTIGDGDVIVADIVTGLWGKLVAIEEIVEGEFGLLPIVLVDVLQGLQVDGLNTCVFLGELDD